VGKIAAWAQKEHKLPLIGGADTFRAAAIEQLQVWGQRADVPVITRERGADPASVCYDVLDMASSIGTRLVLVDTAGRLHTSPELMRELQKVVRVTRKRAEGEYPVSVVLVVDATTGQNGLAQAREFNDALDIDGLILTKLDGTAKGGICVAIADQLGLPIYRVGVGEGVDDLQKFDALEFTRALVGSDE
jgi:fused signal recognition particle receptor